MVVVNETGFDFDQVRATWPDRVVAELTDSEKDAVWRCAAFTVAWIDNQWCWLNRNEWVALQHMPEGAFIEIKNPVFADSRNSRRGTHDRA